MENSLLHWIKFQEIKRVCTWGESWIIWWYRQLASVNSRCYTRWLLECYTVHWILTCIWDKIFLLSLPYSKVLITYILIKIVPFTFNRVPCIFQIYRASPILRAATDGCRSWLWLAYQPISGATYWRCSQTLTLLFHAHRHTFAKRRL